MRFPPNCQHENGPDNRPLRSPLVGGSRAPRRRPQRRRAAYAAHIPLARSSCGRPSASRPARQSPASSAPGKIQKLGSFKMGVFGESQGAFSQCLGGVRLESKGFKLLSTDVQVVEGLSVRVKRRLERTKAVGMDSWGVQLESTGFRIE
jgi:hypothetical protein